MREKSVLLACALLCASVSSWAETPSSDAKPQAHHSQHKPRLDRSGKPKVGKASYYAKRFAGRKMADGTPMNPRADIAASRTLPLGTKAEVTNLENGKSSVVEIRDRGPYVDGRIIDLSPKVAKKLDIIEPGVAQVQVKPLELPPSEETSSGSSSSGESGSGK